jgi:hypothetical protein
VVSPIVNSTANATGAVMVAAQTSKSRPIVRSRYRLLRHLVSAHDRASLTIDALLLDGGSPASS